MCLYLNEFPAPILHDQVNTGTYALLFFSASIFKCHYYPQHRLLQFCLCLLELIKHYVASFMIYHRVKELLFLTLFFITLSYFYWHQRMVSSLPSFLSSAFMKKEKKKTVRIKYIVGAKTEVNQLF